MCWEHIQNQLGWDDSFLKWVVQLWEPLVDTFPSLKNKTKQTDHTFLIRITKVSQTYATQEKTRIKTYVGLIQYAAKIYQIQKVCNGLLSKYDGFEAA